MNETAHTRQPQQPHRPRGRKFALARALLIASFIGLYTLWAIERPEPNNAVVYYVQQCLDWVIMPGLIVGVLSNASVHVASRWILVGANFAIYFGIVYSVARYWEKRKAKRLSQPAKTP